MIKTMDNHVGMSKFKNIFAKDWVPNWPEEVLVINKVKNIVIKEVKNTVL